jgi:polyhydroxybutyrate depolymerase
MDRQCIGTLMETGWEVDHFKRMEEKKVHIRKRGFRTLTVLVLMLICLLFSFAAYGEEDNDRVYITGVEPVEDIEVPNGTSLEDALARLPETTTISVSAGDPIEVELDWSLQEEIELPGITVPQEYVPTIRGPYLMVGTFELPEGVFQPEPPVNQFVNAVVTVQAGPLVTLDDFEQPGTYSTEVMDVNGYERTYHYYVPTSYNGTEPIPVVLNLHGGGSYGLGHLYYSTFDVVAEKEGFVVVCPDYGAGVAWWYTVEEDLAFFSALLDKLAAEYNIDTRRIYATGISQGGNMSSQLAYNLSDRIAAFSIVSSGRGLLELMKEPLPRPITSIIFHGYADPLNQDVCPYEISEYFVLHNQCSPEPKITEWAATEDDPTSITRYVYSGGINGTEVIQYNIYGGGHTWPGKYQYASLMRVGPTTQHLDASAVMWEHFKQHQLPVETTIEVRGSINPRSNGVIQVTIPSTKDFDATAVDPDTVRFGPTGARPVLHNVLGNRNMILHFRVQDTGIQAGDTTVELTGKSTLDGAFYGSDSIKTVP